MKGKKDLTTNNNENNVLQFLIKQNIEKINTIKVVEVVEVYADSVDIKPCVNFLNGDLESVEPNIVFNIPYFTYQCGSKAIKIEPVVGDWGLALINDTNINKIKNTKERANPDNLRKFSLADACYIGSFIKKQTATELIEIKENSIDIKTTGTININSTGATNITASNMTINNNVLINGNLTITGTATASDCISGTISGKTHIHGNVASGTSTTGIPQ